MRAIFYVGKREKLIAQPADMSIAINAPAFDGRFAGTGEKRALKNSVASFTDGNLQFAAEHDKCFRCHLGCKALRQCCYDGSITIKRKVEASGAYIA